MDTEWRLREIKDKIASAAGELDDASHSPEEKENYRRLVAAAKLLHTCADELQDTLMRINPKKK